MARAAAYWVARVIDLADVLRVDLLNHPCHQAGSGLLRF